jgi:hypothetical protein
MHCLLVSEARGILPRGVSNSLCEWSLSIAGRGSVRVARYDCVAFPLQAELQLFRAFTSDLDLWSRRRLPRRHLRLPKCSPPGKESGRKDRDHEAGKGEKLRQRRIAALNPD